MGIDFKVFSDKKQNSEIKGRIDDIKPYVIQNKVDEIYCSLNEISNEKLKELVEFADDNKKTIKFIPDTKDIFQRTLRLIIMSFFLFCLCKKHNFIILQ
jgi:putative colanic acid biosynthesis UDP-glucose lipid carrier transferase